MKNLIYLTFAVVVTVGMFSMVPDLKTAEKPECTDIKMVSGECRF